jgi:hypothetical protein
MFGRKKPEAKTVDQITESDRTTSYRISQDAAPATTNVNRTTSYVNAMQRDGRGYETIN